jgi:hypothetical protein
MNCPKSDHETEPTTLARASGESPADELSARRAQGPIPMRRADRALRCVSSGYLSHGCRCHASVPAEVAAAAWSREQEAAGEEDRFFHFAWRGEVWLGYGVASAGVRGVYCPAHDAERSERSFSQRLAARQNRSPQLVPAA